MAFTFPTDSAGRAGAVLPTNGGNNYVVPAQLIGPDGVTPISSTNALPVALTGSLATLPSQKTDLVGTFNTATNTYTPGSLTVAAGAFKRFAVANVNGYRSMTVNAHSDATSTSTSWLVEFSWAAATASASTIYFFAQANLASTAVAAAGAKDAYVTSTSPWAWPQGFVEIVNNDGANALVIDYCALSLD